MCLGPLGYFFKLNENSKGPWISKNLNHSFIKRFQKKTLEGILGPTQCPPLQQNHYPIKPLHKFPSPPRLSNQFWKEKFERNLWCHPPLHIKIKMDNLFSCNNFWKEEMEKIFGALPHRRNYNPLPFVHKNEKKIMFFFLLIFWKEKFEGTFFIFIQKLKQFFLNFGWNFAMKNIFKNWV